MALHELAATLGDVRWRLNNFYWITDEDGRHTRFQLTPEQTEVHEALLAGRQRLIILKARQLGMTTAMALIGLDCCLFGDNVRYGLIDKSLPDARKILRHKIKYAYRHLPAAIKAMVRVDLNNKSEIEFSNGSTMEVGTSLRGGTYQVLHITELAKIARRFPDKAEEIATGALNTVHSGNIIVIESTGEGHGGLFYDTWQMSKENISHGKTSSSDFHGLFFPWWKDRKYVDHTPIEIPPALIEFFERLKSENNIHLRPEQKFWYVRKARLLLNKVRQEFPSTPKEAFSGTAEGSYYATYIDRIEDAGQICRIAHDPELPVWSLWDIGRDMTSIWTMQLHPSGWRHYLDYLEESGEPIEYHLRRLEDLGVERGYRWAAHLLPHDSRNRSMRDDNSFAQYVRALAKAFPSLDLDRAQPMERDRNLDFAIQMIRQHMTFSRFDLAGTKDGVERLRNYSQEWSTTLNGWTGKPRHDLASHGADAFRTGLYLPVLDGEA